MTRIIAYELKIPTIGFFLLLFKKEVNSISCLEEELWELFDDNNIRITNPKPFTIYKEIYIENVWSESTDIRPSAYKWSRMGKAFLYRGFWKNDLEKEKERKCLLTILES